MQQKSAAKLDLEDENEERSSATRNTYKKHAHV